MQRVLVLLEGKNPVFALEGGGDHCICIEIYRRLRQLHERILQVRLQEPLHCIPSQYVLIDKSIAKQAAPIVRQVDIACSN